MRDLRTHARCMHALGGYPIALAASEHLGKGLWASVRDGGRIWAEWVVCGCAGFV